MKGSRHSGVGFTPRKGTRSATNAAWGAKAVEEMTAARPVMPEGIEDRNADMWEPLLAIAEAAGEHWPKRASVAAVTLVTAAADNHSKLPRTVDQRDFVLRMIELLNHGDAKCYLKKDLQPFLPPGYPNP